MAGRPVDRTSSSFSVAEFFAANAVTVSLRPGNRQANSQRCPSN